MVSASVSASNMPLNSSAKMNSLLSVVVKIIQANEGSNLDRPEHKLLSGRLLGSAKFPIEVAVLGEEPVMKNWTGFFLLGFPAVYTYLALELDLVG